MPISLKHINTSDSDNIKLDNVNYNFDQLVANGGGPRGPQGPIGQTGTQGTTGQPGFQGPIGDAGFQGPQSPISSNYWKKIAPGNIDADTLIPIHSGNNSYSAPVVSIGYVENDPESGTKSELVGGKTPYQWNIYRQPYSVSNLRFLNRDIPGNAYDFKLEKFGGKDQMTMGFFEIENSISTYRSASTSFRSSISSPDSLLINLSGTFFKTKTTFDSPASIINGLIIGNQGADINEIAISADNTGRVTFKSVQELGGTVPFGTIVSILPSIFADNTKFINTESITSQGYTSPIRISAGKGVGNYKGWYLCHGKQWTNGVDTHQVPSIGQFNYVIDDNPFSENTAGQGSAITSNSRIHITGGSNINMTATSVPTLVYNITSTVDTSSGNVGTGTGTTFKIKQLPQIIYLGKTDLYWFDGGGSQNPPIILTFLLDDAMENLVQNPYTLNTITNHVGGDSYSFTSTVTLLAGYYWSTVPTAGDIGGGTGVATITGITVGSGTYPTTIDITFSISSHPPVTTIETLQIDTTNLISESGVNITLNRHDVETSYTCSNASTATIQYNFNTGYYDYTLTFNATDDYKFNDAQFDGFFPAISYDNSYFYGPPAGAGTITVINYTLSTNKKVLTVNLRLNQIPLNGYLTTQGYTITCSTALLEPYLVNTSGVPVSPFAPSWWKILSTGVINYLYSGDSVGAVSKSIGITNQTGRDVYVWVGIVQTPPTYFPPTPAGFYGVYDPGTPEYWTTNAAITAFYGSVKAVSPASATNNTPEFTTFSSAYQLPGGGQAPGYVIVTNGASASSSLSRIANTPNDSDNTIQLYWSSTLAGNKYIINPQP